MNRQERAMREKRSCPRIVVGLPAFLDLGNGADHFIRVQAIDLGVEGLSVCSPLALAEGAHCRMLMRIPGAKPRQIQVNCELVYSELSHLNCEFRLGLRFVQFNHDDQAIVQEYIDWRLADSGMARSAVAQAKVR
jgi:hypothetical protein